MCFGTCVFILMLRFPPEVGYILKVHRICISAIFTMDNQQELWLVIYLHLFCPTAEGGNGNPLPVFLPGKFHGQRKLARLPSMGLQKSWTQLSN